MWIDEKEVELIRDWIKKTNIPMLATLLQGDGKVLWVNEAFEHLSEYTVHEFTRDNNPVTWGELTVDKRDLDSDRAMALSVQKGERKDYTLTKQYRTKSGKLVNVSIHVLGYFRDGEFQCFLVSVHPLDHAGGQALLEIQEVNRKVEQLVEGNTFHASKVLDWCETHPRVALVLLFLILFLVFGDSTLRLLETIKGVMH